MSSIRVLIVDDEPLGRRAVRQLLAAYDDIEIAGEARNGKEAIRLLRHVSPDLMFLDVQMPELDGFAVLRSVEPQYVPLVIFVTAFDTFAVRAFEENALDYLVKPLHEGRFRNAVAKARERLRSREAVELSRRLSNLLANSNEGRTPKSSPKPAQRLLIGTSGGDLILDASEIEWIQADDYYAAIHSQGRRYLVRESLSSLEKRLDRSQFIRVHRTVIVSLAQVREMTCQAEETQTVLLRDGSRIPLSRRRRARVAEALRRYAGVTLPKF
jgi:two-component system LytT family response regulator